MILKFVIAGIVIGLLWMIMFRWTGRAAGSGRRKRRIAPPRPMQLVKCSDCGIYLPAGQHCDCADKP